MYRLIFFQSAGLLRDQKKLLKDARASLFVEEGLAKLAADPFAHHVSLKKLKNSEEATFRLRCGEWRILFDIDTYNRIIIVYRIKPRKEGYA